ncbi:hypothetical protein LTR95_013186 [Oleoguttula sp. CCFEE 5521]
MGGQPFDPEDVMKALYDELGKGPEDALCEAICCDDEQQIHAYGLLLRGRPTLAAKKLAIQKGRPDILKALLVQDNLIEEDLVAAACFDGDRACIRALLDAGWPINQPVGHDASMISLAVNNLDLMQWLVANEADVNARNMLDESALSKAVVVGSMDLVHFLLAKGTDVQHVNRLHNAALRRDTVEGAALIQEFVKRGADPNEYRYQNPVAFRWRAPFDLPTPLRVACREVNIPVAHALLQNGADPHRKMLQSWEEVGSSPLQVAKESGRKDLIDVFGKFVVDAAD